MQGRDLILEYASDKIEQLQIKFKYPHDENKEIIADCVTSEDFRQSVANMITDFGKGFYMFSDNLIKPPPQDIETEYVSWMHITTISIINGVIKTNEWHASNYEEVEDFVKDYPSSEEFDIHEVHTSSIANMKSMEISYMKPKIVKTLEDLLTYAGRLVWRKQDDPSPQDGSSESSEYIKWTY